MTDDQPTVAPARASPPDPAPDPAPDPQPEPHPGRQPERAERAAGSHRPGSFADMFRSLFVVLLGVVVLVVVAQRPEGQRVREVSYDAQVAAARRVAAFPVLSPAGLPRQWRATSARVTGTGPVTLHVGFLTPRDAYAALVQSDRPARDLVAEVTGDGEAAGSERVGAVTWERLVGRDRTGGEQRSLVLRRSGSTVVVTGSAEYDELAILAGSLR